MALVLSRKSGERISALKKVGGGYAPLGTIIVDKIEGNRVKLALEFGPDVRLVRSELSPRGERGEK